MPASAAIAAAAAAVPGPGGDPAAALLTGRKVIHVDMDCFYAAIEEREEPSLRGRPVGVGGRPERRGVLTTCNYAARRFGVRSAMPTFLALQKCPELLVIPPRFELYRRESARLRRLFAEYTPLVEPLSLDEAYLDVTHHRARPATALAAELRARIRAETGLTASAGIAPNKMLAKIASDWRKPDGQHTVKPAAVAAFMSTLPVGRLPGVGPVTAARLAGLGVALCADLQALAPERLHELFGKFGHELYARCRGWDDRPVEPDRLRKSLSTERTFERDLRSRAECQERLPELADELLGDLGRLRRREGAERPIHKLFVRLKFADFRATSVECVGREPTLPAFRELLDAGHARGRDQAVRLLGVGVRFAAPAADHAAAGEADAARAGDPDQLELAFG